MPSAIMTSKGQITVPVGVREELGLDAGVRVDFFKIEKGLFGIRPLTGSVRDLNGLFRGRVKRPVSIEEMNRAIAKGAARSR